MGAACCAGHLPKLRKENPDLESLEGTGLAHVIIERRVEWSDTDAAGQYHFTAVLRWVEQAETVLQDRLGIAGTIGRCNPRVHLEVDFTRPLAYGDIAEVHLTVTKVGSSSITYGFRVSCVGQLVAKGAVVTVFSDPDRPAAVLLPDPVRTALLTGGNQPPERYMRVLSTDERMDQAE